MSSDQVSKITITKTIRKFDPDSGGWKDDTIVTDEYEAPPIGSVWFNNHRGINYTVAGLVASCEDGGAEAWEVLYRSDDIPEGYYRRRSIESWYGNNRHGQPRFVRVEQNEID